ncbi:MAG: transcription antitermination factor NusB [Anaerolineae bacterium]|nr:transcription antitermination factor NusB [Anaerolineae bacterium]
MSTSTVSTLVDYRHEARHLALQALYELDCTSHPVGVVLAGRLVAGDHQDETNQLVARLVRGVIEYRSRLDALIRQYAPDFPLAQLAIIDRNILRLSVYEMSVEELVPIRVAASEAVRLAKIFGAENTARFINGVLGALTSNEPDIKGMFSQD